MTIHDSLHRILEQNETLADLFYIVFIERYPEVRRHFQGVNLRTQSVLLTIALMVMERHYTGSYPATHMYLKYLGAKHKKWGIPAEHYPKFGDALLATLERFHSTDWGPPLAAEWAAAIDRAVRTMLEGYRPDFRL